MSHHSDTPDDHIHRLPLVSDEQVRLLSDSATKQALLEEIMTMETQTPTTRPARDRTRLPRRTAVLATAAAAVAGAVVMPMVMTADSNAAYAVTRQSDGTVRVQINEFRDPEGLQSRLVEEGIPVHVDRVPAGYTCDRHSLGAGPRFEEQRTSDGGIILTLDPADYDDGARLLIEAEENDRQLEFYTVEGEVGECELVHNERVVELDRPQFGVTSDEDAPRGHDIDGPDDAAPDDFHGGPVDDHATDEGASRDDR